MKEVDLAELASELEKARIIEICRTVERLAMGRTDTYWSAHSNACEEILARLNEFL